MDDKYNDGMPDIKQVEPEELEGLDEEEQKASDSTEKESSGRKPVNTFERTDKPFNYWWLVIYAGIIAFFAVLGAYAGLFIARVEILDVEEEVTNYQQKITTRVLDRSGGITLGELAEEKRVLIPYSQISPLFINALISVEDQDFLNHQGVDLMGIARAFLVNISKGEIVQGGSTITQQLVKTLFLDPSKTITRKIREAVLAMQLEAKYTKEEILAFYCNTVYFGFQRYGLEAAARFYYGKSAIELDLNQAATLAGLIRNAMYYTPLRHPERARTRRDLVLDRMVDTGTISAETAESVKAEPIRLYERSSGKRIGAYPFEEVRRFMVEQYGKEQTLTGGYTVKSTVDLRMQRAAERALRRGLLTLSMRQYIRPATRNLVEEEIDIEEAWLAGWDDPFGKGDFLQAIVTKVENTVVTMRIANSEFTIGRNDIPSRMLTAAARNNLPKYFNIGDVFPVRVEEIKIEEIEAEPVAESGAGTDAEPETRIIQNVTHATLAQEPTALGALVAMEAQTGKILAMVGGYDFDKSQFNNAVQAQRQTGSAFKPFVVAAALEYNRATLASTIFDEPTVFDDPQAPEIYEPSNYKHEYVGITTVRSTLERSRNIPAIKLMLHTGIDETISVAKNAGIPGDLPPIYSLALGSVETPLVEMVGAYSVFPNQGVAVEPYLIERIEDPKGIEVFTGESQPRTAISPTAAFLTTQAMIGVFERGTASGAAGLIHKYGVPLGGKTGTTDEYTDAWFIGFSPQIVCGVWVGNDEKVSLGNDESGAVAALPIWEEFMEIALQDEEFRTIRTYEMPPDVIAFQIDRRNGLLPSVYTPQSEIIVEFFRRGTEPTRQTTYDDDYNLRITPIRLMEKRVDISFENDDRVIPRELFQESIF